MPRWAHLERAYIALADETPEMLAPYLSDAGNIIWPECVKDFQTFAYSNVDNAFEGFQSWPLFYLLGGNARFLDLSRNTYESLTRQFSSLRKGNLGIPHDQAEAMGRDTMLVDEWFPDLDWMHQGEAAMLLYYLCLADPKNERIRERVLRITQYLIGENPAQFERNYDPEHHVFRSGYFGTNGPAWEKFKQPINHSHWMDHYGLAFYDVPGVTTFYDLADPENAKRYGEVYGERLAHCDTVTNLMATSMVLSAYLFTGNELYRQFVLEYVNAWRERYAHSDGIMPDNAGPHGEVGETLGGRWYGGHYGWVHPHGFRFIGDAMIIGGENERLLTGKPGLLDWVREQFAYLSRYAITRGDGTVLLPQKHTDDGAVIEYVGNEKTPMTRPDRVTDYPGLVRYRQVDGWYEFSSASAAQLAHIYTDSYDKCDLEKARELSLPEAWQRVTSTAINAKYKGGQDSAYLNYLNGGYANYPEDALENSITLIYKQNKILHDELNGSVAAFGYAPDGDREEEELRNITRELNERYGLGFSESTTHSYYQTFLLYRNPLSMEALVQLTMGGVMPIYNGGMLNVSLRYFDDEAKRPGLPPDVAVLISQIDADGINATLCNLHVHKKRSLILLGGAFGEHKLISIETDQGATAIEDKWLRIELAPASMMTCRICLARFVYQPSYAEPF
jgi:hypothetical protein